MREMKKELVILRSRAEAEQTEISHNAISRLLKLAEAPNGDTAQEMLFDLLSNSRLAVVSSICQGLTQQLLEGGDGSRINVTEASDALVKALETAIAREEEQQQHKQVGDARFSQERGVTQCLARCLISTSLVRARRQPIRGGGAFFGVTARLLSMERGLLYPALSHEAVSFVSHFDADPREAVGVLCPLASTLLLQPEYVNLRGGFLLKLSAASATSRDGVKLCVVILQAELLVFSALHTAAHADLAAGWFCSLVNTALSLDSDASWSRASRTITWVVTFLITEFRERGAPIAPLLGPLRSMAAADPLCLADEVAFLGISALQSHCIDERKTLLDIVRRVLSAIPQSDANSSGTNPDEVGLRARTWSLETLVYPLVSMAGAGNTVAARVLPLLEAALKVVYARAGSAKVGCTQEGGDGQHAGGGSMRYWSAILLGILRLSLLGGGDQALVAACEGLRRRAGELQNTRESTATDLECGLCLLAPLVLRPHNQVHSAACAALVAVGRAIPTLGVRLLPFVLYAIRKLGGVASGDGSVVRLVHVLPELGAHKLAAKPVAGVVQALGKAPQAAVRGLGLRLAAALVQVNSRTFNQLQSLLCETPADHNPPLPPEPDVSRICRVAGMLEICESDPELGLECVRPLQAFLGDASAAVTAMALKAIAALCRGDCLDFDAALRIVTKKGKVAHTRGDSTEEFGDPRVMEAMAQLCGAGAEAVATAAAEASGTDSDGSGDDGGVSWGMGSALRILLERSLGSHPDETVRAAVYAALSAHLPALLQAATGKEAENDATAVLSLVREFLGKALSTDESSAARSSLQIAAAKVLAEECVDPSTWVSPKRAVGGRDRGGEGGGRSGPSNRLLAALPAPESILHTFRQDNSLCPGLAGAVLWCYPAPEATAAVAHRDAIVRDFCELLTVEGTGGGLALCPWQRAVVPLGIQRYVARLLAACLAVESAEAEGRNHAVRGADVTVAAAKTCHRAIVSLRGVRGGLVAVASASLASCAPASASHIAVEETGRAVERLRAVCADMAPTLLDGEEFFPLCTAMAARALPETAAEQMEDAFEGIEHFYSTVGFPRPSGKPASDNSAPNEGQSFWSCVAVGVASEWSLRHPTAPEARKTVLRAARLLLVGLAGLIGSEHVSAIAETLCRYDVDGESSLEWAVIVGWESIDVGQMQSERGLGLPTTPRGSSCLALFLGLSSTLPGLRATGLHPELLQVFHIIRALASKPEAGLCGASLCLASAASECLSCGLVDAPTILGCLRSISQSLDALKNPYEGGKVPAQDTFLGAAGLVVACEGKVVLPAGFAESVFERLREAAAHRRGADSGVRVASFFALASLVGCPLLCPGENIPKRMRITSIASRRMIESLLHDVSSAMDGTSIRPKNAAARIWGCISALGQDERSVADLGLQEVLGWTQGSRTLGTSQGGGGNAGAIKPDALCVAREGTLMDVVLTGLQSVAAGVSDAEGGEMEKTKHGAFVSAQSSLFAASALACLERCSALRVPHAQMAVVVEALFRGGHGVQVQKGAVQLGLALADKDQIYSTWLRGLFHKTLFVNLPLHLRRHLISVVGHVFSKLPQETAKHLMNELWEMIATRLFTTSARDGIEVDGNEGMTQATIFLSELARLAAAAAATTDSGVESLTMTRFLPSILQAFSARGNVSSLSSDAREAPFWDALVGLLSRFPWDHIRDAIALTSGVDAATKSRDLTVRGYLTSRLAPAGEAESATALGSVARWATLVRTKREASATVMPRLAEALKPISITAAGVKWLLALLDTAELQESCPLRAVALVGGAAAVWEPCDTGVLVAGEKADELLGRDVGGSNCCRALLYATSVSAPRAVLRADNASPDASTEVLARLLRLSGLFHGRVSSAVDERNVMELRTVRCGLEGFIRGLRHAPAVLNGTLSKSFASYAESVATDRALSWSIESCPT